MSLKRRAMQKIYLLLRNNNQLGPFTIEELLEQELLPSDLIWVEGKSLAWSYASELNLLKLARAGHDGAHHAAPPPTSSSVHSMPPGKRKHPRLKRGEIVSRPPTPEARPRPSVPLTPAPMSSAFSAGDVERKAEELRQRALEAERTSFHYHQPVPAHTGFTPDLTGNTESDIEVVYHKRGLHIPFPQVLVGGMVVAMLVAGWYGQPLFRQKIDTVDATATPLSAKANTAAARIPPAPVPVADTTAQRDTARTDSLQQAALAAATHNQSAVLQARYNEPSPSEAAVQVSQPETTATERPVVVPKKNESETAASREPEKPAQSAVGEKKDKQPAVSEPVATASEEPKEKKRGFLKGLFKKKKNKEEEPTEEATHDASSGN